MIVQNHDQHYYVVVLVNDVHVWFLAGT